MAGKQWSLALAAGAALAAEGADAQRAQNLPSRSPMRAETYTCRLDARPLSAPDYRGIRDRAMTNTEFRATLEIDASGRVTVCRALGATGNPAIERRTCELVVRRARTVPRSDVFGNPVASRRVPMRLRLPRLDGD